MFERLIHESKRFHIIKLLVSWHRSRSTAELGRLWEKAISADTGHALPTSSRTNAPTILLGTSLGAYQPATRFDSLLSVALSLRGANVHAFLCDGTLPACQLCHIYMYPDQQQFVQSGPRKDLCRFCFGPARKMFKRMGTNIHGLGDWVSKEEKRLASTIASGLALEDIQHYTLEGVRVGEHAWAGALRFFARGTLDAEPQGEAILRRYFESALLTAYGIRRLVEELKIDTAVFHHGIYVPQGVIGEVCRQSDVRVVNWHVAYRKGRFILCDHDTYHRALLTEPTDLWEDTPWTLALEADLMDYLESRWHGARDWIHFNRNPENDLAKILETVGIDPHKPCIGLLTNVVWDAQLHYPTNAFPNMLEWLNQTIAYFSKRPELQLIIRVHPAEISGSLPSRQPAIEEIQKSFPELPANVFIIPPDSPISTYVTMLQCNAVIIFATKTGVELTSFGIPVIVAGEAFVRNKGFTHDATSVQNYFDILDQLPFSEKMSTDDIQRARKYAYHFFFRRMIPLEFVEPRQPKTGGDFFFEIAVPPIEALMPGKSKGLDIICDGITSMTPFVFRSEETALR